MTKFLNLSTLALALGFSVLSAPVASAADDWEKLGCRDVGFAVDRDSIAVGQTDGHYKRIKLRVKSAPIEFYEVRVVFGSGSYIDVKINQLVEPGSESRPIDLPADARVISQVDMIYRSVPAFKGAAEVCVIGKQD